MFFSSRSHSFLLTACSMGILAIALSMNFGLSNTIVQEHAPPELRGRVSAVFGLSFFGLMPIAGLVVTGFSDLVGMRTALAVASVIYGIAAFAVLSLAGRHVCDRPTSTDFSRFLPKNVSARSSKRSRQSISRSG